MGLHHPGDGPGTPYSTGVGEKWVLTSRTWPCILLSG